MALPFSAERPARLDLADRVELPAADQAGDEARRVAADRLARTERQIDERRDDEPVPPLIALEVAVRLGVVVGEEVELRPRASSSV